MIAPDVKLGKNVKIWQEELVNLYGCEIGDDTKIGAFVEIGKGVVIGKRCLIQAYVFLCDGVTIEDDVFVGPGVKFSNDKYPPSYGKHWMPTKVYKGASIGLNCTIVCGVTIGKYAMIGAGAVVTKNIPPYAIAYGNPARVHGRRKI